LWVRTSHLFVPMAVRHCVLISIAFWGAGGISESGHGGIPESGNGAAETSKEVKADWKARFKRHRKEAKTSEPSVICAVNFTYLPFVLILILVSAGPWLWIGCNDSAKTSAWGTKAFSRWSSPSSVYDPADALLPLNSPNSEQAFEETMDADATSIWIPIVFTYMVAVSLLYLIKEPERWPELLTSYLMSFGMSIAINLSAYRRFGRPSPQDEYDVRPSMLINFAIYGGLLGIAYTVCFQPLERYFSSQAFPCCSGTHLNVDPLARWPAHLTKLTPSCGILSAFMWIMSEGLVEETGKAMWLFWRLRVTEGDLPRKCFFGQCSSRHAADCCGGWFKLAPSPRHVLLCALACGAGYDCLENIKHGFHRTPLPQEFEKTHHLRGVHPSLMMVVLSEFLTCNMHIAWTGLIGAGLAKQMFCRARDRVSLIATLLPSVILHGIFDWGLASLHGLFLRRHENSKTARLELTIFLIATIAMSFCTSCFLLHRRVQNLPTELMSPSRVTGGTPPLLQS